MSARGRAIAPAPDYLAKGDPAGWFKQVYREAAEGKGTIPRADSRPNPICWPWAHRSLRMEGRTALKIDCGLGDDAEPLAKMRLRYDRL